jgi:uncharacterized spore protein YtfJ
MEAPDLFREIGQALANTRSVFGEPYTKDGLAVLPVATIRGGGGGGGGPTGGGGFGFDARPAGAYVIENGQVRWQPAIDVNHVLVAGVLALLTIRSILRVRARTKRRLARRK